MVKRMRIAALLIGLFVPLFLFSSGCKKKVAAVSPPPPPAEAPLPPPAPPAPSISLRAEPPVIRKGASARLIWEASDAKRVSIEPGLGEVDVSGERGVSPEDSTTYTATATGPGGSRTASARVTVAALPKVETARLPNEELFPRNVRDIYFDFDKHELHPDALEALRANARALKEHPEWVIIIEGHCDERGTTDYNLALGDRRATATREFLIANGIAPDRLPTLSFGEEQPVCTDHGEECWGKNRRAHFARQSGS